MHVRARSKTIYYAYDRFFYIHDIDKEFARTTVRDDDTAHSWSLSRNLCFACTDLKFSSVHKTYQLVSNESEISIQGVITISLYNALFEFLK